MKLPINLALLALRLDQAMIPDDYLGYGWGGGGASLTRTGASNFAPGAAGIALGQLVAPSTYTVFTKVAGNAKIACSATGALTTNATTAAGEVLTARFRAATADGTSAIEATFTVTATGAAATGGVLDFSLPGGDNTALQTIL